MSQTNVDTEWQKLCHEYSQARDAQFEAFLTVTKKLQQKMLIHLDMSSRNLRKHRKCWKI